ncbi:transcription factor HES-4-B-like [Anopheles cruzii]|uniref:transcription factor HES-4-B-like n=1 Tax=Anopheles cruzii TaxID=68878 RepID=UPI0022EC7EAD|nr:transcription factor HES-4-B-like [Anopheles cruzii]
MEKKRRARINHYLNDLKGLLLDAMKKDPVRHSKLEKADILDLTVKHLQDLERRRFAVAMAVDPSVPEKFATGYRECIDEISKYFDSLGPALDDGLKGRVRKHLESCLSFPPKLPAGSLGRLPGLAGVPLNSPDDINNNHALLNRTLANNLSLLSFPGAGLGFGPASVPPGIDLGPFNPFPFFSPFQRPAGHQIPFPGYTREPGQEKRDLRSDTKPSLNLVPSPPVSPSDGADGDSTSTTTDFDVSLRTPVAKGATAGGAHHMEQLLAIFPTPPSPEDRSAGERFGKLDHHGESSPFVPTGAAAASAGLRPSKMNVDALEESVREAGSESESDDSLDDQGQQQPGSDPDGGAGGAGGGEMWRPW